MYFYEMIKILATVFAFLLLLVSIAYLVFLEVQLREDRKKREAEYRKSLGYFKSGLKHTYNKMPAYKRSKKLSKIL